MKKWIVIFIVVFILMMIFGYIGNITDTLYDGLVTPVTTNNTAFVSNNGTTVASTDSMDAAIMSWYWIAGVALFILIVVIFVIRSNPQGGE